MIPPASRIGTETVGIEECGWYGLEHLQARQIEQSLDRRAVETHRLIGQIISLHGHLPQQLRSALGLKFVWEQRMLCREEFDRAWEKLLSGERTNVMRQVRKWYAALHPENGGGVRVSARNSHSVAPTLDEVDDPSTLVAS
jgi:hypothetical protein